MIVMPAVGLGALVVFLVGFGVTYEVLELIAKRKKTNPALYWDTTKRIEPSYLTEKKQEKIALVGGGLTLVLMILSLLVIPQAAAIAIWQVLTVLGILFGLFTFFITSLTSSERTKTEHEPSASSKMPPTQEDKHGSAASTRAQPPTIEDPYRTLLAKARYDKSQVERLIENERRRMPYASLDDLCRSAIAGLERNKQ